MEELMRSFLEDFNHYNTKKEFTEIINDELSRREEFKNDEDMNINEFGSNEYCYIIFENSTTDEVKSFKLYFNNNYKKTKIRTTKERYLP